MIMLVSVLYRYVGKSKNTSLSLLPLDVIRLNLNLKYSYLNRGASLVSNHGPPSPLSAILTTSATVILDVVLNKDLNSILRV